MKARVLVAYSASSTDVQTTYEYLEAFSRYLNADVEYIQVTNGAIVPQNLDIYDVIINNYCARLCFDDYVSRIYLDALRKFRGVKILTVQDEYEHTNKLKRAISNLNFDYVLTCVPQDSLEYVYPKSEFPNTQFITVLTGYVPDHFMDAKRSLVPLAERPVPIGYRGRDLGAAYGKLGILKYEIGRRMREICEERGISHDIAMDDKSRIYGSAWFDFIGQCRVMLGSESGSNVFDFDGSIQRQYQKLIEASGGRSVSYEEFRPYIEERERAIDMGQVSPRVFECAMMKTPMVLFRGRYSGVVQPDLHYIPLEPDFENVDEVLRRIEDLDGLSAMAERAYLDVVASGRFGYRAFMGTIQGAIEHGLIQKGWVRQKSEIEIPEPPLFYQRGLIELPTREVKRAGHFLLAEQTIHKVGECQIRLGELMEGEASAIKAYLGSCDWSEAELAHVCPYTAALNKPIEEVKGHSAGLREFITRLQSETEEFSVLYKDKLDGVLTFDLQFGQELVAFISARMEKITQNIGRLNQSYGALYASVMELDEARKAWEKTTPAIFLLALTKVLKAFGLKKASAWKVKD